LAEKVAVEMLARERWKELITWETTLMADGLFHGIKVNRVREVITPLRSDMMRHLFHTMYDTKDYVQRLQQRIMLAQQEQLRLKRLNTMTVG
jgi:hypothetical protein